MHPLQTGVKAEGNSNSVTLCLPFFQQSERFAWKFGDTLFAFFPNKVRDLSYFKAKGHPFFEQSERFAWKFGDTLFAFFQTK